MVITSGNAKLKTKIVKKSLNPVWNATMQMSAPSTDIKFVVMDHDVIGKDDFLGEFSVPLSSLMPETTLERWFELTGKPSDKVSGSVHILLHLTAKATVPALFPKLVAKGAAQLFVAVLHGTDLAPKDKASCSVAVSHLLTFVILRVAQAIRTCACALVIKSAAPTCVAKHSHRFG